MIASSLTAQTTDFSFVPGTTAAEAVITGYTGTSADIVVPERIDGRLVTEIGTAAFEDNLVITSVVLPEDLLFINERAFAGCANLVSVTIPGGVSTIFDEAFAGCANLTSVIIEEGVELVFEEAFRNTGIARLVLPASVTSLDPGVFAENAQLEEIFFLGNAPLAGSGAFPGNVAIGFFTGATGFAEPTWDFAVGETVAATELGSLTAPVAWLLREHLDASVLLRRPEVAGWPLLLSYALDLDPQAHQLPQASVLDERLEIQFFANRSDVIYIVESSLDLSGWDDRDVVVSEMDGGGFRTAAVSISNNSGRFLRIRASTLD